MESTEHSVNNEEKKLSRLALPILVPVKKIRIESREYRPPPARIPTVNGVKANVSQKSSNNIIKNKVGRPKTKKKDFRGNQHTGSFKERKIDNVTTSTVAAVVENALPTEVSEKKKFHGNQFTGSLKKKVENITVDTVVEKKEKKYPYIRKKKKFYGNQHTGKLRDKLIQNVTTSTVEEAEENEVMIISEVKVNRTLGENKNSNEIEGNLNKSQKPLLDPTKEIIDSVGN